MRRRRKKKADDGQPDLFGHTPPPDPPVPSFPARHSDPEPSQDAAENWKTDDVGAFGANTFAARMLAEFDQADLTDDEAAGRVLGPNFNIRHFNACRRRASDLRRAGYIVDLGEEARRCNVGSSSPSTVSRITEAGKTALQRLLKTGWSK